jgi:hypothetical protein
MGGLMDGVVLEREGGDRTIKKEEAERERRRL